MVPTVKDVLKIIDEIAPFDLAEKWDNPGLQAGSYGHEINKILIALDPTVESVNKTAASGAQLLLTHHPLLFRPVSVVDFNKYPGDVIHEAVKKDSSRLLLLIQILIQQKQGSIIPLQKSLG